jgi:hypothetical protein
LVDKIFAELSELSDRSVLLADGGHYSAELVRKNGKRFGRDAIKWIGLCAHNVGFH